MSKNISNTAAATAATASTASSAATSSSAKRVTKKSDPPAAAKAVEAQPAAKAVEAQPVKKAVAKQASAKAAEASVAAPVAVAAASTVADAPVASASEQPAAEVAELQSVEHDIQELIKVQQLLRDQSVAAIKNLLKLQKRVQKEIKEAGRRRRRVKKEEDGQVKEKRPTIFTTPVTLKDELCVFLGKAKGSQMTPADVTRAFSAYVKQHKLKDEEKGHTIHPDAAMRKVLGLKDGEEVSYRTVQTHLYKLYVLPEKKSATSSA